MTVLFDAGVNLALLLILFVPLERVFPARSQPFFRARWWTDLCFFFGQRCVFVALATWLLSLLMSPVGDSEALLGLRLAFSEAPWALQMVTVIAAGDFCAYWGHRLQHHHPWLWRFHAVHHSAEHLDWLAAHREHPLDGLYTQFLVNLPLVLLGFNLHAAMGLVVFRGAWAIFIHANTRLPLGALQWLVGSPALHHWHHAPARDVGNYANLAPWLDILFGTYHLPAEAPPTPGPGEVMPRSYLGLLVHPFQGAWTAPKRVLRP